MPTKGIWTALVLLAVCAPAQAATLVTHETERYFYQDGNMTKYDGQYEVTYFYDIPKNFLVRTRVYDYQRKIVKSDNTVYHIQKSLDANPTSANRFGLDPVIRAIGKPDSNTIEVVSIAGDSVVTMTSTGSSVIVSRADKQKFTGDAQLDAPLEKKRRP